jgi:group I intron endonuclease
MIVYCIANLINDKKYVGQTRKEKPKLRFTEHSNTDSIIGKAIRKYGKGNFSFCIIDTANTQEELNQKEIFWIKELKCHVSEWGYNAETWSDLGERILTGEAKEKMSKANKGIPKSQEVKDKISNTLKGNIPWNKGLTDIYTEEQKRQISDSLKEHYTKEIHPRQGKNHTEETKQLISDSRKGKCVGFDHHQYNKPLKEETKQKISKTKRENPFNKPCSEETKQKISLKNRGSNKPWVKLDEEKVLEIRQSNLSRNELARLYNVNVSTIRNIILRNSWSHI